MDSHFEKQPFLRASWFLRRVQQGICRRRLPSRGRLRRKRTNLPIICQDQSSWKTFISNRVSQIHEQLKEAFWLHVKTNCNPADCASRGITPSQLKSHSIWWTGPTWLSQDKQNWPKIKEVSTELEKKKSTCLTTRSTSTDKDILQRFSNLLKLVRVTAQCLRFYDRLRKFSPSQTKWLTAAEHTKATNVLIKLAQTQDFAEELSELQNKGQLSPKNRIAKLNPFVGEDGILRVGGRLEHSNVPYKTKHPVILCGNNPLTALIIDDIHNKSQHGGNTLTLNLLRQKFWVLNARNAVKFRILKCIECEKQKAKTMTQLMGNLPRPRVTETRRCRLLWTFRHKNVERPGGQIVQRLCSCLRVSISESYPFGDRQRHDI